MYREFHQEKYFDAPDIQVLPHTLQALGTLAQIRAQRQAKQQDLEANYKIGVEQGSWPEDQKEIVHLTGEAINELHNHFNSGGQSIPNSVKNKQMAAQIIATNGKVSMDQYKSLESQLSLKKADDPYYNASADEQKLKSAFSMKAPEREAFLNSFQPGQNTGDYNIPKMTTDYVNSKKIKSTETDNKGVNGIKATSFKSYQFTKPNGTPGITLDTVDDYLKGHPKLFEAYSEKATKQITDRINNARANDEEWTHNKTDEELFSDIYHGRPVDPNHPIIDKENTNTGNIETDPNGKPIKVPMAFGDRVKEIARQELKQAEETHNKSSIDASDYNAGSRYGITSKNYSAPAPGFRTGDVNGPSLVVYKKTGSDILPQLPSSKTEWTYNNDTGKYERQGKNSEVPFGVSSVSWGPVDKLGRPVVVKDAEGKTPESTEDMIRILSEKPNSFFVPETFGGISGVKAIFSGRSINKANIANLAFKSKELNDKAKANPQDKTAQNNAEEFDKLLDSVQQDKEFDHEVMQKYMGTDFVKNTSFATTGADDPNVQSYEAQTGMNVYNPKSMTPDQKQVKDYINMRIKEAKNTPSSTIAKGLNSKVETSIKTEATPAATIPQKGEERQVQGGTAVFNGTKWELKK